MAIVTVGSCSYPCTTRCGIVGSILRFKFCCRRELVKACTSSFRLGWCFFPILKHREHNIALAFHFPFKSSAKLFCGCNKAFAYGTASSRNSMYGKHCTVAVIDSLPWCCWCEFYVESAACVLSRLHVYWHSL